MIFSIIRTIISFINCKILIINNHKFFFFLKYRIAFQYNRVQIITNEMNLNIILFSDWRNANANVDDASLLCAEKYRMENYCNNNYRASGAPCAVPRLFRTHRQRTDNSRSLLSRLFYLLVHYQFDNTIILNNFVMILKQTNK